MSLRNLGPSQRSLNAGMKRLMNAYGLKREEAADLMSRELCVIVFINILPYRLIDV